MALAYVRKDSNKSDASGTALTVTWASGVASPTGRLLVAVHTSADSAATLTDFVTPAGWSVAHSLEHAASPRVPTVVYYKVTGGAEPTNYTFSFNIARTTRMVRVFEYSGSVNPTPLDKVQGAVGDAVQTLSTGTTATLAQANELVFTTLAVRTTDPTLFPTGFGWTPASLVGHGLISSTAVNPAISNTSAYRNVTATTAVQGTASWTLAGRATAIVVTFKEIPVDARSGTGGYTSGGSTMTSTGAKGGKGTFAGTETIQSTVQTSGRIDVNRLQESTVAGVSTATSIAQSWPSDTATGSLLLAALVAEDVAGTLTVTPPATWVAVGQVGTAQGIYSNLYYIEAAASRSGVETFTWTGARDATLQLLEVAGIQAAGSVDKTQSSTGLSVASLTGSTTEIAQDREYLFAVMATRNVTTFSNPTRSFEIVTQGSSGLGESDVRVSMATLEAYSELKASVATRTTLSASRRWAGRVVTFKASIGAIDIFFGSGLSETITGATAAGGEMFAGGGTSATVTSATVTGRTILPSVYKPVVKPGPKKRENAILLSEPQIAYDFAEVRNEIIVLGSKPEGGLKRIRGRAVADRGHPLSPWSLARNGEPSFMTEVIDTDAQARTKTVKVGKKGHKKEEEKMVWSSFIRRQEHADEIAERELRDRLRAHYSIEADILPQPHWELGDMLVLRCLAGRFEFRLKRYSLGLGVSEMALGVNRRLRLRKGKRRR